MSGYKQLGGLHLDLVTSVHTHVLCVVPSTWVTLLPGAFSTDDVQGGGFSCRGEISASLLQFRSPLTTQLGYYTRATLTDAKATIIPTAGQRCFPYRLYPLWAIWHSLKGSQLRWMHAKACTSPKSHGGLLLQAIDQRKPTGNQRWQVRWNNFKFSTCVRIVCRSQFAEHHQSDFVSS